MHLVIFDIDGTLIHSHEKEVDCFIQAYTQVMGSNNVDKDLTNYQHVTDTGIATESIFRHFQRHASDQELTAIEENFLTLFDQALTQNPPQPIYGVHSLFEQLAKEHHIYLAIATGSYYRSALLKLQHANLLLSHLPLSSCDDHIARIEIMRNAENKAKSFYGVKDFTSITYVGDGPWDINAVNALEWQFIGIASNYPKEKLQEWGAQIVVNDYSGYIDSFVHLIRNP